jgi:phosphomannomutase
VREIKSLEHDMQQDLSFFKAYDIRGTVPEQLNEEMAYAIGRAYASFLKPTTVVVGHDIRLSSPSLAQALTKGLLDSGVNVTHIGQCGTEEVYFSVFDMQVDGGICVTASHNPANYNGMKFVGKDSRPIGSTSGLDNIKELLVSKQFTPFSPTGKLTTVDRKAQYVQHLLRYVDHSQLKPLKLVVNPGNGGAGAIVDALAPHLPFLFEKVHFAADGHFPNGVPNPLLPENRTVTHDTVLASNADFGIAWDGDFDRCFFFDEKGQFIEGYYLVSLLAKAELAKHPGGKIVFDPRLYWATEETVKANGGKAVVSQSGHAFIKQKMREEDAVYGGEMSAHHYFKDFAYCDNGTIPWLLVAEIVSKAGKPLSALVADLQQRFPCSGEINLKVADSQAAIKAIENHYRAKAQAIEKIDGLGMTFDTWRFNVRQSNTEPLLRVNVETRMNKTLLAEKTDALLCYIKNLAAQNNLT